MKQASGGSGRDTGQRKRAKTDRDRRNAPNDESEHTHTRSIAYTRLCPL
jgi:hypothetical protein